LKSESGDTIYSAVRESPAAVPFLDTARFTGTAVFRGRFRDRACLLDKSVHDGIK